MTLPVRLLLLVLLLPLVIGLVAGSYLFAAHLTSPGYALAGIGVWVGFALWLALRGRAAEGRAIRAGLVLERTGDRY